MYYVLSEIDVYNVIYVSGIMTMLNLITLECDLDHTMTSKKIRQHHLVRIKLL